MAAASEVRIRQKGGKTEKRNDGGEFWRLGQIFGMFLDGGLDCSTWNNLVFGGQVLCFVHSVWIRWDIAPFVGGETAG